MSFGTGGSDGVNVKLLPCVRNDPEQKTPSKIKSCVELIGDKAECLNGLEPSNTFNNQY